MLRSSRHGLLRQPLATALSAALLATGLTGAAWATYTAHPHHHLVQDSAGTTRGR